MIKTNNLKIKSITPIIAPTDLRQVFPMSEQSGACVSSSRAAIHKILKGEDRRLMVVVGPCSIHDPKGALEYAEKLAALSKEVSEELLLIMRVYFEKPRTTIGWKGLINDPGMDGTHLISKGLGIARGLLCKVTEMGLPVATEMLGPISSPGARSARGPRNPRRTGKWRAAFPSPSASRTGPTATCRSPSTP